MSTAESNRKTAIPTASVKMDESFQEFLKQKEFLTKNLIKSQVGAFKWAFVVACKVGKIEVSCRATRSKSPEFIIDISL